MLSREIKNMQLIQVLLLTAVLGTVSCCAHAQVNTDRQILLLKLASNESEPVPVPASDDPIFLSYRATVPAQSPLPAQVYVRIFRGTKNYLIKTMPQFFKRGCVDYSSALLTVSAGGQLSFRGLNTEWLASNKPEHFTLVFEASDPNSPGNSMLRLSRDEDGIAVYFNSGIEIQLMPPAGFSVPVRVTSAPASSRVVHTNAPPVDLPPCHVVHVYRARILQGETHTVDVASLKLKAAPCGL
jgi:hypothetical protein